MVKYNQNICLNQIFQPKSYKLKNTKKNKSADNVFDLHLSVSPASFKKDVSKSNSLFSEHSSCKNLNHRFLNLDSNKQNFFLASRISSQKYLWFNDSLKTEFSILNFKKFESKISFLRIYSDNVFLTFVPTVYVSKHSGDNRGFKN